MMWLKFLHVAGLSLWLGGLLYLPAMLWAHHKVEDQQDFARIRMASRFVYMGLASPAAFVAIGAGAALLFVADALHPWMFLKLAAVGVLVIAHMQYGYVLARLAREEARAPTLRVRLIGLLVLASAAAALWLVLAKPVVGTGFIPDPLLEPGILQRPEDRAPPPSPLLPHPRS
jgi:protoporphyrinogen IX oxidase